MGGLTPGSVTARTLRGDPDLPYFLFVPEEVTDETALFVTVHGRSRNAVKHAELFAPFVRRLGIVMVAPLFTKERFPDYNCLGRAGRSERADLALDRILAEAGRLTGGRTDRIYLFGYSGGGQFAHRYAMAYPDRVAAVAIGAPGWYTFPEGTLAYPRGLRSDGSLPGVVAFDPHRFLRLPMPVLVGERDIQRDPNLNQEPDVDAQQGLHRVERARRWTAAMQAAAGAMAYDTAYTLEILPGVGHSFVDCMTLAGMGDKVFAHLFPARSETSTRAE